MTAPIEFEKTASNSLSKLLNSSKASIKSMRANTRHSFKSGLAFINNSATLKGPLAGGLVLTAIANKYSGHVARLASYNPPGNPDRKEDTFKQPIVIHTLGKRGL